MDREISDRFNRHLIIPGIGEEGQEKLLNSSVLIVGCGGLGSASAFYLCAAGVGTIGLADPDHVSLSNLQRQILHNEERLGLPKTTSARMTLSSLNGRSRLLEHHGFVDGEMGKAIIPDYDLVIDATDNVESRYNLNRLCHQFCKPFVTGAVQEFSGMLTTIIPGKSPCYQCLFPRQPNPGVHPVGVLSPVPGVLGALQAMEAVKVIVGFDGILTGRLLVFEGAQTNFDFISYKKKGKLSRMWRWEIKSVYIPIVFSIIASIKLNVVLNIFMGR